MSIEVIRVGPVTGPVTDLERARRIRREVFVDEFGVTEDEEYDDRDEAPDTVHVVAVDGDVDVGTARLVVDGGKRGVVHITRVAVSRRARGRGAGRAMMSTLEEIARSEYAVGDPPHVRIELSVMEHAVGFYAGLGYEVSDERHLEVRIWHHYACKVLVGPSAWPSGAS